MSRLEAHRLLPATALLTVATLWGPTGADAAGAGTLPAGPPDATADRLERIVRDRVASGRSTGIVAGLVLPDGRTRVVAAGPSGRGARLDADSVFEIGSITKVFTGTVLAEMAGRGEVELTDPVSVLLPPGVSVPSRGGRQITLEHLATHSSGLPRDPTNLLGRTPSRPYAGYTAERLHAFLGAYTLPRDPGSRVEYSNAGAGLLGHALALRAGRRYEDLVRERVLDPLRMTSTAIAPTTRMRRRLVVGHDEAGRVAPRFEMGSLAGAGALRSSLRDMLRFAAANLEHTAGPLGDAMATARASRRALGPREGIGLHWFTARHGDREIVWHNGGTAGFLSFIGLDQSRRTAVVVLSNSRLETVDDIGFHILDRRLPLRPPPPKAVALPRAVLASYVGVYEVRGTRVSVTRSTHGLSLRVPGQRPVRLLARSRTRFAVQGVDATVVFRLGPRGRVTGLALHQDGRTVVARRVTRARSTMRSTATFTVACPAHRTRTKETR